MTLTDAQIKDLLHEIIPYLPVRIENLKTCLKHVEPSDANIYSASVAQNNNGMPHGSGVTDKVANIAFSQGSSAEAKAINAELSACTSLLTQYETVFNTLPEGDQKILQLYDFEHKSYADIAEELTYSESQCKRRRQTSCDLIRRTIYIMQDEYKLILAPQ